ncbi:hypothetical protein LSH36_532g05018 [Paralvinella palmiformis]|uniref:Uncharacterized protein n=1 Tax=Paralvinella palmiformis TaxID=53620 RepID=A0AAD9MXY5_9ANNE|nr:hypothetical protein LSH36_532g05018 [Paralvinella palmiformis]
MRDNGGLVGGGVGGVGAPDYGSSPSSSDASYAPTGARVGHGPDASPDSGVDTEEVYSKARPLQRRKTLPSIVKRDPVLAAGKPAPAAAAAGETARSQQNLSRDESDTYIIENGIRKRVKAEVYSLPKQSSPAGSSENLERPKELPKRYRLESPSRLRRSTGDRGSLPDVSACKELQKTVMPRAQVSILSEKRRRELMKQEEEDRKKQQEIVLRLGDVKNVYKLSFFYFFQEWCQQRQLVMLVIAVNVSLATMFFNLLSQ